MWPNSLSILLSNPQSAEKSGKSDDGWSVNGLRGVAGAVPRKVTGAWLEACLPRYLVIFGGDSVFEFAFANYGITHNIQNKAPRVLDISSLPLLCNPPKTNAGI